MPWLARWVRNGDGPWRAMDHWVGEMCGFSWRNVIKCLFTPDLQIEHHCYTRKPKPKQNTVPPCLALYKALCGTCEFTRADFQEHNDSKTAPSLENPGPVLTVSLGSQHSLWAALLMGDSPLPSSASSLNNPEEGPLEPGGVQLDF